LDSKPPPPGDKQQLSSADSARGYLQRGWQPIPLEGKAPIWKDWPDRIIEEGDINRAFSGNRNVGIVHSAIIVGDEKHWLIDVDLDSREAVDAAPYILPATPMRHGRPGSGVAHYWYLVRPKGRKGEKLKVRTVRLDDPAPPAGAEKRIVELLGNRTQSMVPPSIHPSGEAVRWCKNVKFEPPTLPEAVLKPAVEQLAAVTVLARRWVEGQRSELAMYVAGWWAKSGISREQAEQWVTAICAAANDNETSGRLTSLRHTYDQHERGEPVAGWQWLSDTLGEDVMRQCARWLGLRDTAANHGTRGTGGKLKCGVNPVRYELVTALGCTDSGNASRLLARYGEDLLYCAPWHTWLNWIKAEGRWSRDETQFTRLLAASTAGEITTTALAEGNPDNRATLLHWAAASANAPRIAAMLEMAQSARSVAVVPQDLDNHPTLLNAQNGTLHLDAESLNSDAGPLRPPDRAHHLTRLAPVSHDVAAKCPRWDTFLAQILDGDFELVAFLARLAGYCLLSGNPEQYVVILHGTGANGKSTLLETLKAVLGDYASTVAPEVLMSAETGSNNQLYALASLRAARLVTASETEDGRRLAESLIKTLTGGEAVMAREPYGAPFEFTPEFTPFIATNHRPQVHDSSEGMWRRLLLVPFNVEIPRDKRDPELGQKLLAELPGILNWMLEGLCDYYDVLTERGRGLSPPLSVQGATASYRAEQDVISAFIEDCCARDPDVRVAKGNLRRGYEQWCEENGVQAVRPTTWVRKLKQIAGVSEQKSGGTRYWTGLTYPIPGHLAQQMEEKER